MSLSAEDKIQVLQRFVDSFPADLLAVRDALGDASTPEAAQKFLIGGLNYAMDMLDIYPDNNKGIGIADDAMVLRLAAKGLTTQQIADRLYISPRASPSSEKWNRCDAIDR